MLKNPTTKLNVLGYSCAKIRFKQLYLSNHSELITGTYELFSSRRLILSPPTILNFPLNHLYISPWIRKKYSTNNFSASPVFLIHVSVAVSYHTSHNVMFIFLMNIMYLLNYI